MRVAISLIAVISMGALSQAFAADPETPQSATAPQPAQDSSPAQAAPSPPDLQAGAKPPVVDGKAPAPTAVVATKTVVIKGTPYELTHQEQLLLSRGYKLEPRNGEKVFCRREQQIGSRLAEVKRCGTASDFFQQGNNEQDEMREGLKYKTQPIR
jgi:hypothetical protein